MNKLLITALIFASLRTFAATNTNYLYSVTNTQTIFQYDAATKTFTNVVASVGAGPGQTNAFTAGFKIFANGSSNYYLLSASNFIVFLGDAASNAAPYVAWSYSNGVIYQYSGLTNPVLGRPENPYKLYGTNLVMNGVPGVTTNILASQGASRTNMLQFSSGVLTNVVNNF